MSMQSQIYTKDYYDQAFFFNAFLFSSSPFAKKRTPDHIQVNKG